jgi:phosphatidylglycerophosphate synthase
MPLHPRTCSGLYSVSCLLDALDGYAARHFEQSTRFGAVLDMVTDRCTTACLLVFLASAWPRWAILFQGLISLDLASHYVHMYATLIMGGVDTSHKKVDKSRSFILNLYYTNKVSETLSPVSCWVANSLRRFCSSSALSTNSSSSPCTYFLSLRHSCLRPFFKFPTTERHRHFNREALRFPPHAFSLPIRTVLERWSMHEQIRWTRLCRG